jgi:hypothetical protein
MRGLDILIWVDGVDDWSIEVDGSLNEHVAPRAIQLFVRWALTIAETSHVERNDRCWTLRCFVSAMAPGRRNRLWPGYSGRGAMESEAIFS